MASVTRVLTLEHISSDYQQSSVLFVSKSAGNFDTEVTYDDGRVEITSTDSPMQAVLAFNAGGVFLNTWRGLNSADTASNRGGVSIAYSSSSNVQRVGPQYCLALSSGCSVTVIDAHGTHSGLASGTSTIPNNSFIGVRHKTTEVGYTFSGWKITSISNVQHLSIGVGDFSDNSGHVVVSSGGSITTGSGQTTVEFGNGYENAVCIHTYASNLQAYALTIEAIYQSPTPTTKTVTWMSEGTQFATTECTVGEYYTLPTTDPEKSGYNFVGWFDAETGGNQITGQTAFTDSSPTTIYAQFVEIGSYSITYDLDGGTGGPQSTSVLEGESYTIPSGTSDIPTKESYMFAGWLVGDDPEIRQPGYSFTPDSNTTITAQWSGGPTPPTPRPSHEVGYIVYGDSSGTPSYSSVGFLVYAV